ncbi:hypothetical protein [Caminibacter pacificus]|jgi:hypothetical protein
MKLWRYLFYLLFVIAFFAPMIANIYITQNPNETLKAYYVVIFKYFNLIYYAVLIIFLFASFKFKEAVIGGIIFILGYLGFIYFYNFYFAKMEAQKKAEKLNAVVLSMDKLKDFGSYKLLYKKGFYVVVKKAKYDHTNPFGYVKDQRR